MFHKLVDKPNQELVYEIVCNTVKIELLKEALPIALCAQWSGGKDACLDVTVVSPHQRAMVAGAAATDGFAL